jgi:hypothetical protein
MSKRSDKKSKREKLPSDPYWHLGKEEDFVNGYGALPFFEAEADARDIKNHKNQWYAWNVAIAEAVEQVLVKDDPEIQVPRLADDDGVTIVQDNSTRPRMSFQWVAAPVLERIAAFLQRGDPIKPGLAKVIGRLLAGEPFFSPPFGDSYQFDDDGNIVRDDTKITKFTLEAWTYRLVGGKVIRTCKGQPPAPGRARHALEAAYAVRDGTTAGGSLDQTIKDAAKSSRLTPAEVRKALRQLERQNPQK